MIIPVEKYGVKLLSIGFFVDPDQATLWRGGMASNALKQLIGDAAWGDLDYFLIDLPPGTSDIHLTVVQTLALTGAVVVSTPQAVALADARKGINMFTNDKVNVPISDWWRIWPGLLRPNFRKTSIIFSEKKVPRSWPKR